MGDVAVVLQVRGEWPKVRKIGYGLRVSADRKPRGGCFLCICFLYFSFSVSNSADIPQIANQEVGVF